MYDGGEPDTSGVEIEQALLGILLYDGEALDQIGPHLQAAHFAEPAHRWLFDQIKAFAARGDAPDPFVIHSRAGKLKALEELGGLDYLTDLLDRAPATAQAGQYAAAIFDAAQRKHLIALCREFLEAGREFRDVPAFELVAELRARTETLESDAAPTEGSMVTALDAASTMIQAVARHAQEGRPRGRMTGLRCIDRRLGGLLPGKLIGIGGRPGMGKTSLARAILHGAARRNPEHLFVYLGIEMGPEEMVQREVSAITHELDGFNFGIEYQDMAKGKVTPHDLMRMDEAALQIPPNLILDDCPSLSLDDVKRKVWALKRQGRIGAIAIDYLQLMQRREERGKTDAALIGEITMGLKQIARRDKDNGFAVLLLSQLSRTLESREEKRPVLSDLRESGAIEQDCDVVLFPFREHYYLEREGDGGKPKKGQTAQDRDIRLEETRTVMEVICAKQRQGAVGTDKQVYRAAYDHISD